MIKKLMPLALSLTLINGIQKATAQIYIAPEVGLALNKLNSKTDKQSPYVDHKTKAQPSFNAGVGIQIKLSEQLSIQSGIFYDRFRYAYKSIPKPNPNTPGIIYAPSSVLFTIHYACLPVSLRYDRNISKGSQVFAGLGGYVATTISGTIGKSKPYKRDLWFGNGDDYKALDAGVLGYIGYQSSFGLFVRLQDEQGLRDLSNNDYEHNRTSGLSLSVGYRWHVQAN